MKKHLTATQVLAAAAFSLLLTACADVDDRDPRRHENLGAVPAPTTDNLNQQDAIRTAPVDSYGQDAGGTEQ